MNKDTIRDTRDPGWFWADNVLIDRYAKEIGPIGVAVYMALARFADRGGRAFPSHRTLAALLGTARNTVKVGLDNLIAAGLVTVAERSIPGRDERTTNEYTLLPMSHRKRENGVRGGSNIEPKEDSMNKTHGTIDPPPTPSAKPMPIGGGGGGSVSESTWEPTETSAWMQEEGFSKKAQQDLRSLDLAAARADFSRRRALGQGIGAIVTAWRDKPPTARAAEHNPMDGPWAPSDFARVRAMLGIAEDEP